MPRPALVLLHFFGSSHREWDGVADRLRSGRGRVLAIDLPGFGDAAAAGPADVARMVDVVAAAIDDAGLVDVVVVGHSMSGKVAAVLAARRPPYLRGLVLVAAAPPSPEPMADDARAKLLAFDGSRQAAGEYIDGITAKRLPDGLRDVAIADAMRASPDAWTAWVVDGSQEDWSRRVGVLDLPARVIAGANDPSLGVAVQRERVLPHFGAADLVVIDGGHALPLENPDGVVDAIVAFIARLDAPSSREPHPTTEGSSP